MGGPVRQAGLDGGLGRRAGRAPRADRQAGRPGRRRAGHRRPAGPRCGRPGRRPADHHAPDRALSGRLRAGDAYRDVGAPGHAGQRRDAHRTRRAHRPARLRTAHRCGHRSGPAAGRGGDLRRRGVRQFRNLRP